MLIRDRLGGGGDPQKEGGVTFSKRDTILALKEPFFLKNDPNQARELIIRNCWTKFMIRKLTIFQFSIVRNSNLLETPTRKILIKDYFYIEVEAF